MRLPAYFLLSLGLAAAIVVAGFVLLHALPVQAKPTARSSGPRLPEGLEVHPRPLHQGEAFERGGPPPTATGRPGLHLHGRLPPSLKEAELLLLDRQATGLSPLEAVLRRARPGPDGSFSFADLPPGPFELRVLGPEGPLLTEPILLGGRDLHLDLRSRIPPASSRLQVLLAREEGEPLALPGALVILWNEEGFHLRTRTDGQGELRIPKPPEGPLRYRIRASRGDWKAVRSWEGSLENARGEGSLVLKRPERP